MVRTGQGAALIGDYLSQGIVTVGWLYNQDMASIPDRDELERRLRLEYPDQTNAQIRSGVGQAGRFLLDFEEGDQVLSYDPSHHDDSRLAVWILTYLYGVHVRMASAFLAVLFSDDYTVMDARAFAALESLGWTPDLEQVFGDQPAPPDFLDRASVYEVYLQTCRAKASEFDVSLRTLDRFLYTRGTGAGE